jgi:CBS domain-containing protein
VGAKPLSLLAVTAGDLMSRDLVRLTPEMPLREAAGLLLHHRVGGAPVVDGDGRCVGVLSATDFLRLGARRGDINALASPPLPITCPFQVKHTTLDGGELILCDLPPGVCPIQGKQKDRDGKELLVCREPHCVLADWQIVELEKLPTDEVRNYMTADPVTVPKDTPIRVLARQMIDAHIHRVIVVDEGKRPIGIVSSTDVLAAVAYAEDEC